MAPKSTTNKAKAAGIGASSFLDLKAELAAKEKEISENKAAGKNTSNGHKQGKVCLPRPLEKAVLIPFFSPWLVGVEADNME
jgi:hypothetical protein